MDAFIKTLLVSLAVALLCSHSVRCKKMQVKGVSETMAMRNCSDGPPVTNYFNSVNVVHEQGDGTYVTAEFTVDEPVASNLKWKALVYKCTQRDARIEQEGCEFFLKVERKDMCGDLVKKDQLWSPFFNNTEPPFVCPLAKGVYKFKKIKFDYEQISKFAVPFAQNYYWVSRALVHKGRKPWACTEYVFKLGAIRG